MINKIKAQIKIIKRAWRKEKPFMWNIVELIIWFNLFQHHDKFKEGDFVRYNWKAKIMIPSVLSWKDCRNKTLIIKDVWGKDKANVHFVNGLHDNDGCDAFWLRKAYWWEI